MFHCKLLVVTLLLLLPAALCELSIVAREDWQARAASDGLTAMELPLERAVIAHTAGRGCSDDESCAAQVRAIQSFHMNGLKYSDISYHYLIGGNGKVYAGRSSSQRGAIAVGNNAGSLGIAFIGNFDAAAPTEAAVAAAQALLQHAVAQGELKADYKLLGHCQLSATKSPGDALFALLKKWPQWSNNV
ncbi:peptidoglycan-recognition protein SD [Drosophila busckii]|uniref:peptidoglycan-recognition protein SD n=1 Tax=Drosophila busckii TaxID=30019 RepID=UPI00083EC25B|nr:peptidoglycan-recognition protein SD [Drosophila busckii]